MGFGLVPKSHRRRSGCGRRASAEGGSVPNGVGMVRVSTPSPADQVWGSVVSYLYDKNMRGTICTSVPLLQIPPVIYTHAKSVTLNELERRNGRYFALFYRIWQLCGLTSKWMTIGRYFLHQKCSTKNLVFSRISLMAIFAEVTENK